MAARRAKRRPTARSSAWFPALLTVVTLFSGYLAADLLDAAPGPLTFTGEWPDAEPFPTSALPEAPQATAEFALDPAAPIPTSAEVDALVRVFRADPAVGPNPALLIRDALTGEVLADVNGSSPRTPASTTKLLTAVAALDAAGATYQFITRAVAGASGDDEAVTIIASGDLTLAEGEGDPTATIGRGGIGDLAAEVAKSLIDQGRTEITNVVIDESIWEGPRMAPRWEQIDLNEGWIIPMAPIAINLGKIKGQMPRQQHPVTAVGNAMRKALEDHGITVRGTVRTGTAPENAAELGHVASAPLAEITEYMLVYSDNVLAESLGRLAATESGLPGSFEGAEQAIKQRLGGLGVDTEGLRLADTSGLSSDNKISPRTLLEAMAAVSGDHPHLLATVRGLPIAGLEGTLRNRMRGTDAAGVVVAKTGTLRTVATIAGQVHTRQGRLLHVAIMTSDWENSLAGARAGIDRLLAGLAECGCDTAN